MARSMPGGDENAARDVGEFVAGTDALADGGAALVVHRTGKDGDRERGSGALRAAADLMVKLERDGLGVTVTCDYLRDAEEWSPLELTAVPASDSLVLEMLPRSTPEAKDDLRDRVLGYIVEQEPISKNRLEKDVVGRAGAIRAAASELEKANLIHLTDDGWAVRPGGADDPGRPLSSAIEEGSSPGGTPSRREGPLGRPRRPPSSQTLVPTSPAPAVARQGRRERAELSALPAGSRCSRWCQRDHHARPRRRSPRGDRPAMPPTCSLRPPSLALPHSLPVRRRVFTRW